MTRSYRDTNLCANWNTQIRDLIRLTWKPEGGDEISPALSTTSKVDGRPPVKERECFYLPGR